MEFLEEQLDVTRGRIVKLESNVAELTENVTSLIDQLKETQRYLIKLAYHQNEIAKRMSNWPFIAVPENKPGE